MVTDKAGDGGYSPFFSPRLLLVGALFLVPALSPPLFGWLTTFLAIPVFLVRRLIPGKEGWMLLGQAFLLSGLVATLVHTGRIFLFSMTMVPLGLGLQYAARRGRGPVAAGGLGILILLACWGLYWGITAWVDAVNPYLQLQGIFDQAFAQTFELYRQNNQQDIEMLYRLQEGVTQVRELLPRVLPGILGCTVVTTVWINLVGGNSIVLRHRPVLAPWPSYGNWRLPDHLVWPAIASMILLLFGHGIGQTIGITTTLICGLLYFFQGLAVSLSFMDRWQVPRLVRFLFYILVVIQSYGLVLLAIIGLADVWADFRKPRNNKDTGASK